MKAETLTHAVMVFCRWAGCIWNWCLFKSINFCINAVPLEVNVVFLIVSVIDPVAKPPVLVILLTLVLACYLWSVMHSRHLGVLYCCGKTFLVTIAKLIVRVTAATTASFLWTRVTFYCWLLLKIFLKDFSSRKMFVNICGWVNLWYP